MSILSHFRGPESKYDHRLPYTYEARVAVAGVDGLTQTFISDTLCALLEKLGDENVKPGDAAIFEVRPEGDVPILIEHCLSSEGSWLRRPEACRAFQKHYAGHVEGGRCCYRDRERDVEGPIVEMAGEEK